MKKYRLKGLPKGITCTLISELHGEGEKIPFFIEDNMKSFSLRPEDNPLWFEEIKDSAEELAIELAINTGQFHKWEELDDSDKRYYRNEAKYIFKHFTRKVK